jgi:phosphoglycolate phosphatase-like HAD superfamily hydrolase
MLQTSTSPLCIVTAKDSGSVQELLHHAGVRIPDARIHGECRDKVRVLKAISETFAVPPQDVYFFDDNVLNARDALGAGFRSHWALWGYHAPEHFRIAQAAGLPAVELEELIRLGTEAAA